jgi:hypothetical protein
LVTPVAAGNAETGRTAEHPRRGRTEKRQDEGREDATTRERIERGEEEGECDDFG